MLDVNWQSTVLATALDYERAYVTLPVFAYAAAWQGASEIICQFNFSASNNFVLRSRPTMPANANYVLAIRYRVGQTIYRYRLWGGIGENMPNVPLYNPSIHVIKKNFVLEVWNIETSATVSQATALTLWTSVRRAVTNYRSVSDYALADSVLVYPLTSDAPAAVPAFPTDNLRAWYAMRDTSEGGITDASGNARDLVMVSAWTDDVMGDKACYAGLFGNPSALLFDGATPFSVGAIIMSIRQDTWNNGEKILDLYTAVSGDKIYVAQAGSSPEIHVYFNGTDLGGLDFPLGNPYLLHATFGIAGTLVLARYDVNGGLEASTVIDLPPPSNPKYASKIALGATGTYAITEVAIFDATFPDAQIAAVIRNLADRINVVLDLPLTFNADVAGGDNDP